MKCIELWNLQKLAQSKVRRSVLNGHESGVTSDIIRVIMFTTKFPNIINHGHAHHQEVRRLR